MNQINSALKGKFNIVGLPDGITKVAIPKFGEVDFATLSLQQATTMHAMGCRFLEKVADELEAKPKTKSIAKKGAADG